MVCLSLPPLISSARWHRSYVPCCSSVLKSSTSASKPCICTQDNLSTSFWAINQLKDVRSIYILYNPKQAKSIDLCSSPESMGLWSYRDMVVRNLHRWVSLRCPYLISSPPTIFHYIILSRPSHRFLLTCYCSHLLPYRKCYPSIAKAIGVIGPVLVEAIDID